MSRRTDANKRRKLGLKRETVRQLSARDLGQVAGGSWYVTDACDGTYPLPTGACFSGVGTGSRFC
jgi:hypothetical protein